MLVQLAGLALIAGAPAILGAWLGGYAANDVLAALFFGIAAGAAIQVVVEVARYVARTPHRAGSAPAGRSAATSPGSPRSRRPAG